MTEDQDSTMPLGSDLSLDRPRLIRSTAADKWIDWPARGRFWRLGCYR